MNQENKIAAQKKSALFWVIENAKKLKLEDYVSIFKMSIVFFVSILFYIIVNRLWPESAADNIAQIISGAILIPTIFHVLGKFGASLPIEKRIYQHNLDLSEKIQALDDTINSAIVEIGKHNSKNRADIYASMQRLQEYIKYQNARFVFGFNHMEGVKVENDKVQKENLPKRVIDEAGRGDKIFYMTTYISDTASYRSSIEVAIKKGVNIQLLLMYPSTTDTPIIEARLYDIKDKFDLNGTNKDENIKDFVRALIVYATPFINLRNRLDESRQSGWGRFEIKFYTKSLNFPLVCIEKNNASENNLPIAYTGFYAGENAEEMPYVVWRGGDFQIYKKFKLVFHRKWNACTLTSIQDISL